MKKLSVLLLAVGMLLSGCASDSSEPKELSEVKIGAIQFAQHPALDNAYEGFKDTLVEAGIKEENIELAYKLSSKIFSFFNLVTR